MTIATPILSLHLIDVLMNNQSIATRSSCSNAAYSTQILSGELKKSVGLLSPNSVFYLSKVIHLVQPIHQRPWLGQSHGGCF